jgi:hypothetical protein
MSADLIPVVEGVRRRDQLVIFCPYCGKPHHHGAGGPGAPFGDGNGHREAHCGYGSLRDRIGDPGYIVREAVSHTRPQPTSTEAAAVWLEHYIAARGGSVAAAQAREAALWIGHSWKAVIRALTYLQVETTVSQKRPRIVTWALRQGSQS